jgi:transcriptional regulator with XRE-family HTH domain
MGFRENLKRELLYQGMMVKELAAQTEINNHTIANYLSTNNYMPSADNAVKIAAALGVSVEYLVTGEEQHRERTISSLHHQTRALVHIAEKLTNRDRNVILATAKALQEEVVP